MYFIAAVIIIGLFMDAILLLGACGAAVTWVYQTAFGYDALGSSGTFWTFFVAFAVVALVMGVIYYLASEALPWD